MDALKPIRTNTEHAAALKEVDRLLALPKLSAALEDRLEALTILIEAFESSHPDHRLDPKVDPIGAIEFHLDRLGKNSKDLELILGCSRTRVWEILHRRRALTLVQIRALVDQLGIPAERLIADYPLVGRKPSVYANPRKKKATSRVPATRAKPASRPSAAKTKMTSRQSAPLSVHP